MSSAEPKQEEVTVKIEDVAVKEELAGSKRKAESEADDDAGDAPAPKAVKAEEGGEAAEDAAAEAGEEAAAAEGGAGGGDGGAQPPAEPEPVTVGYKTFASGKDAKAYYHGLISKLTKYQNLNDYEFHMVLELIKKGHPEAERKVGGGVRAIQVREVEISGSVTACFFLLHDDGSEEDVSYRKCLGRLFPDLAMEMANSNAASGRGRGGRGGGRGSSGRGGGRGGRGGGRGRGRGGRK
ncbi:Guanine nucleotide-binding subunit beta 1 [Micractinium conductrix]|uniref:Guanine nucleotide-binding subunit beta 1 n=1 Tax=Micractinium conductrix TaxID=554055 RepID=A0A2P6V8M4_9CHLO|nr:Guanine nucleotide-binding subunit beta 1 [Micractinium conductrix]|eukprot:PSC70438.1 Guanine nucleotide-binding subunit beta 1 [Micractinium conductrix]